MHALLTRCYLLIFILFLGLFINTAAATQKSKEITITLPADAVRQSLSTMLPLPIEPENKQLNGKIIIESIDRLKIHGNTISLGGVVSGKNLSMTTNIAGQNIKLKLGQVQLPLACDLLLRFDSSKKILFITPKFQEQKPENNNPASALTPLLAALGSKEYPVDLNMLQPLNARIGKQTIAITMEPAGIIAANNQLVIKLIPKNGKPR